MVEVLLQYDAKISTFNREGNRVRACPTEICRCVTRPFAHVPKYKHFCSVLGQRLPRYLQPMTIATRTMQTNESLKAVFQILLQIVINFRNLLWD